jgi:hypothetical protein
MKRYVIITCSVLAFLLFCSKSCETTENENAAREEISFKATLDSINKTFEADYLSEQTLRAFEVKAEQKLVDFADYLQIYADKSLDESFKDHARQMILDLFISDSIHIKISISKEEKEMNLTIKEFLRIASASGSNVMGVRIDSLEISEPLHRIDDGRYAGSLKFSQRFKGSSSTNNSLTQSQRKTVDIIAAKIKKQFGNDTLQIWQVCLGDIR